MRARRAKGEMDARACPVDLLSEWRSRASPRHKLQTQRQTAALGAADQQLIGACQQESVRQDTTFSH